MANNVSLVGETIDALRHGSFADAADIWRHEGLKRGVESAMHHLASYEIGRRMLDAYAGPSPEGVDLSTNIGSLELEGPVGIAPGWDKTGRTLQAWQALGAHHVTPGGVTFFPQAGNGMPRLRTFDVAVGDHGTTKSLNSYGFYNPGRETLRDNIETQRRLGGLTMPVIVQLTANKELYSEGLRSTLPAVISATAVHLEPVADAFSFGLSSPNTMGMRDAQAFDILYEIIDKTKREIQEVTDRKLEYVLKGDGDGDVARLELYVELVRATGVNLELINTTALQRIKEKYGAADMPGGLAGADADYHRLAMDTIRYVYDRVGDLISIVGCGGVHDGTTALDLVRSGASAVSLNTAVRTRGLGVVREIEREMVALMPANSRIQDLVGSDTQRGPLSRPETPQL